ncbi:MAG: hypothetical protein M1818_000485 [Claussenomyces sp. TS43310]|nr:MAG: hypothetical protein M1818_000485 [Claussenomyces sp. TS43310]
MEALTRQEYPAMLASLQPSQAASVLNDRVKRIGKVNTDIANWLEERRKIEERYAQDLQKLVSKQGPDIYGSELGIFAAPWQRIVDSTSTVAQSHLKFAKGIEKDVVQSLYNFATQNREMQAMSTIQGNLGSMAKELEDAQERSEKLSKKGGKASSTKVDSAAQKLEVAISQWESQAPFVFEKLQAVDESRLNHLRDVLTQFQTHEADQVERGRVSAESTLNLLLEVDTAQEIQNFARATTQGKPKLEKPAIRRPSANVGSSVGSGSLTPPPPPTTGGEDDASLRSGRNEASSEPKGLKRFGTMLGRRRQSIHGSAGFARAPSPSKGIGAFGRSHHTRDGRPSPSPRASSTNLRDSSGRENRLSSLAESPTLLSTANTSFHTRTSTNGDVNGAPGEQKTSERHPSGVVNGGTGKALPDLSDVQAPPGPPPSQSKPNLANPSRLDSEGFSLPALRSDPISLAQQEAADESESPAFKLDIRTEPIREEDADAQAALSNVANTLRSSSLATPGRKVGTVRGRRDVRNTMYIPSPDVSDLRGSENSIPASPGIPVGGGSRAAALAALSSGDPSSSDTQSIRSAHSLTSNVAVKHPDLHQPGLNASIIETVSAYLENGLVKTASVVGEIALNHGYDESNPMSSSGTETIRLNNFPILEAIAPNHAFVEEAAAKDRQGEYTVNVSHLAKPMVAFRYKVHVDQNNRSSQAPIIVKPAWRSHGDNLGLIVEYMVNPAFAASPITLHNFVIMAAYEGGRAAGCQTKPTGTHLKEKSLIYWRIGDVTLGNSMQKVISKLTGAAGAELKAGLVEVRWEYHGSSFGSGLGIARLDAGKGKAKEEVDPFADESATVATPAGGQWVEIDSSKKIVSGKYDAKEVVQDDAA